MDLAEQHQRSVHAWTDRLAAVGSDQWDLPTPCTDWTVRDLANHVTGEDRWTVPLVRGERIEDVGTSLDGDLLGTDPAAAGGRAAAEATRLVAERLPRGGTVHLSYGEETLDEYVRQLVADHLVHAWDLAVATDGDRTLDDGLVAEVSAWFAEREEAYRAAGVIGPRAGTPSGADPQTELLAAFGRDPSWAPVRA